MSYKSKGVGFIRSDSKRRRHKTTIVDERDGSTAGTQTEHWSGRVDAVAFAKAAVPRPRVQED